MRRIHSSLHSRPSTSLACLPNDQPHFLPFSRERDNLGRLIRPRSRPQPARDEERQVQVAQSKMEEKMDKYFKQTGLCNLAVELTKDKPIKKKSLISILFSEPGIAKHPRPGGLPSKEKRAAKAKAKVNEASTRDELSPPRPATTATIARPKNSLIPRCSSSISTTNVWRRSEERGKEVSAGGLGKERGRWSQLELEKCQQLSMYHRRQQLEVKMLDSFEEGHLRFIDKMKKSKKLAFEVKLHLDQIDNYC